MKNLFEDFDKSYLTSVIDGHHLPLTFTKNAPLAIMTRCEELAVKQLTDLRTHLSRAKELDAQLSRFRGYSIIYKHINRKG